MRQTHCYGWQFARYSVPVTDNVPRHPRSRKRNCNRESSDRREGNRRPQQTHRTGRKQRASLNILKRQINIPESNENDPYFKTHMRKQTKAMQVKSKPLLQALMGSREEKELFYDILPSHNITYSHTVPKVWTETKCGWEWNPHGMDRGLNEGRPYLPQWTVSRLWPQAKQPGGRSSHSTVKYWS